MDHGPAVVLPVLDDVDLVAAAGAVEAGGAVLGLELQARPRLPVEALGVAVAERVDRRSRKRVVGGDRAVGVQAERLPPERVHLLRDLPRRRVARRHVQLAVRPEPEPAARVELRRRQPLEDHLPVRESRAAVMEGNDAHPDSAGHGVGVGEVEQSARRIVRSQRQSHEPRLAPRFDVRDHGERILAEHAVLDHANAARPLRDEHPRRRGERQRPRHLQAVHEGFDLQRHPVLRLHAPAVGGGARRPEEKNRRHRQARNAHGTSSFLSTGGRSRGPTAPASGARETPTPSGDARRGPSPLPTSRRTSGRSPPG